MHVTKVGLRNRDEHTPIAQTGRSTPGRRHPPEIVVPVQLVQVGSRIIEAAQVGHFRGVLFTRKARQI